jgi:FkbM family methyltransferase
MSTPYFILTKSRNRDVADTADDQIVFLSNRIHYILPQVNIDYYSKCGFFESALIEWCRQFLKPDQVFLDIGAHTGTYALSLADSCAKVEAFEPQRATYYSLCGSIALSNLTHKIEAHHFGLGSEDQVGAQNLHIVSADGGGSSLWVSDQNPVLRTEPIEVRTLDSMNLSNIGFVKMDVEGNELSVLKGAQETLRRSGWPTFMFESNRENGDLFDFIRDEMGYTIISISGTLNMFLATYE